MQKVEEFNEKAKRLYLTWTRSASWLGWAEALMQKVEKFNEKAKNACDLTWTRSASWLGWAEALMQKVEQFNKKAKYDHVPPGPDQRAGWDEQTR
jgi:hypothetical protein